MANVFVVITAGVQAAGKSWAAGDLVEVSQNDANILLGVRRAVLATPEEIALAAGVLPDVDPEVTADPVKPKRGRPARAD